MGEYAQCNFDNLPIHPDDKKIIDEVKEFLTSNRGCRKDESPMLNTDWNRRYFNGCYFYSGRDCPGWSVGGTCSRIGRVIEDEQTSEV